MTSRPRRPRCLSTVCSLLLAALLDTPASFGATPAAAAATNPDGSRPGLTLPVSRRGLPGFSNPAPDSVFGQEQGRKVGFSEPLRTLAYTRGRLFAGSKLGLHELHLTNLVAVPEVPTPVDRLVTDGQQLWVLSSQGLRHWEGREYKLVSSEPVTDLTSHRGEWIAATARQLWRVRDGRLEPISGTDARFPITRVLSHQDTIHVHGSGRLAPFAHGTFGARDIYNSRSDQAWDWGALPSRTTRDARVVGPVLYLATDRGLALHRGMSLGVLDGRAGLPFEDTTCLADGFEGDLWIGTTRGAIRRRGPAFDYFAGQRWLPHDRVHALAVDREARRVAVGTETGLGLIEYLPFTLEQKAAYYEAHLEAWGQKRLGFVHKLEWEPAANRFVREISDNDGGYTGNYLAAQAYRYAVTRDPDARREATNTFHALRWLEQMTGIPGLPARSVWAKGETGHKAMHGSGGLPAEWHDTPDGRFEWKGDTSSDELCSHFYAFTLFLELVADADEAALTRRHLARIADHLIDQGWRLIDADGRPTRWGRWDPEYFETDEGKYDRGLQCLELLSFIKTAEVLTGEPRFARAYRRLVELDYPRHTLRERNTFPPENVLHFLDELALWSYWNLLRYEEDPELRALYRRSLERTYEVIRVEHQPWFNFVYSALTGHPPELEPSLEHLRGWPLDLRVWSYQNSHRTDLRTPAGYSAHKGGTRAFVPRETEPMRWDRWTMQADGGAGGNDVVEPAGWLLAYWMGRYHGFIAPPDPQSTPVAVAATASGDAARLGALPYDGPPRPPLDPIP